MENQEKNEHLQSILSQHNLFGIITGFALTALILMAEISIKGGSTHYTQKTLLSLAVILLPIQIYFLLRIAENERKILLVV